MMDSTEFVKLFGNEKSKEKIVRYGYIDHYHIQGQGLPHVVFDGEDERSSKQYPHLSSYEPYGDDRVMLIKNVIIGKVIT